MSDGEPSLDPSFLLKAVRSFLAGAAQPATDDEMPSERAKAPSAEEEAGALQRLTAGAVKRKGQVAASRTNSPAMLCTRCQLPCHAAC